MLQLLLRERGPPVGVPAGEWQRLRLDETIGTLSRNGVIRLERVAGSVLLFPSHFVGQMRAPTATLTVAPKDDLMYQAIRKLALRFSGREARHYAAFTDEDAADPAAAFTSALGACIAEGFPWRYEAETAATSSPRGKIDFTRTTSAFASRGIVHKVIAGRRNRRQRAPIVEVVRAAHEEMRWPAQVPDALRRRAAHLICALDDCAILERDDAIAQAESLLGLRGEFSDAARRLLQAALALLDEQRRAGIVSIALPVGSARFFDLETLWERAVAELLSASRPPGSPAAVLHPLRLKRVRLFDEGGPAIDPDVMVKSADGEVEVVADAKYKVLRDSDRTGIASDVYQIACYADRIGAEGMLVYVGTTDSVEILGRTAAGARISCMRISGASLVSGALESFSDFLSLRSAHENVL